MSKIIAMGVLAAASISPLILNYILREQPYESRISSVVDSLHSERVVYKNRRMSRAELTNEVLAFKEGKIIWRGQWIPAGDTFVRTVKRKLERFSTGEQAYKFTLGNLPPEKPQNASELNENRIYSSGEYYATLRKLRENDYWLHFISRSDFWANWNLVDIRGIRI